MDIDFAKLAADTILFLTPYLPYLIKGGKIVAQGALEKVGANFVDSGKANAEKIWSKIKSKADNNSELNNAIEKAKSNPNDKRVLSNLEYEIEQVFKQDDSFAQTINDIHNSIVIVGDRNVVGNRNVVVEKVDKLFINTQYEQTPIENIPDKELINAYLRSLANECSRLPLGVVDPRFLENSSEDTISLPNVYIDLDVDYYSEEESDKSEAELTGDNESNKLTRMPVLDALNDSNLKRLVLLGDPGSGKTTCLHYITFALCLARQNNDAAKILMPKYWKLSTHFPIRLVLRDVASQQITANSQRGTADMIWSALQADLTTRLGNAITKVLFPKLQEFIIKNPCLIMLDGLDEVTETDNRREKLVEAINLFSASLMKESCILVTARPYAYHDPKWQLPNFKVLALLPFNNKQIKEFISRWYEAVRDNMKWDEFTATDKITSLNNAILEKEYLFDLASRPLLLTLMATLHTSWGKLPDDRADLYEETIRLLLDRWQRWRISRDSQGNIVIDKSISIALSTDETSIRRALNQLAWNVHQRQGEETLSRKNDPADIRQAEVEYAFSPHLPDNINSRLLVKYLETRAGLLLGRGKEIYSFPHRSFQEYLAACHINDMPDSVTEYEKLIQNDPTWWREVFLLGIGKMSRGGLGTAMSFLQTLLLNLPNSKHTRKERDWQIFSLIGEAVTEIKLISDNPIYERILIPIRNALTEIIELGHLSLSERAKAGNILSKIGDERVGVINDFIFCKIPSSKFLMGSKKGDKDSHKSEYPQFEYHISYPYYMSQYPVTNGQFELFVKDAKGYTNDDWWTEEGLKWRGNRKENNKHGGIFSLSNHPVVGVTWYEACAFTKWATKLIYTKDFNIQVLNNNVEALGLLNREFEIRLPTESEWECAARGGIKGIFPWGNDDVSYKHANYRQKPQINLVSTNINSTSTVGLFLLGKNNYGLMDMSGNVWEWCITQWRDNYDNYIVNENNQTQGNFPRAYRGGSCYVPVKALRCATRNWGEPDGALDNLGFRIVLVEKK